LAVEAVMMEIVAVTNLRGPPADGDSAALVPQDAIGLMLSPEEAGKPIRKLERRIPKRAAAALVSRRGKIKKRSTRQPK
jgi:hypothetical protein